MFAGSQNRAEQSKHSSVKYLKKKEDLNPYKRRERSAVFNSVIFSFIQSNSFGHLCVFINDIPWESYWLAAVAVAVTVVAAAVACCMFVSCYVVVRLVAWSMFDRKFGWRSSFSLTLFFLFVRSLARVLSISLFTTIWNCVFVVTCAMAAGQKFHLFNYNRFTECYICSLSVLCACCCSFMFVPFEPNGYQ